MTPSDKTSLTTRRGSTGSSTSIQAYATTGAVRCRAIHYQRQGTRDHVPDLGDLGSISTAYPNSSNPWGEEQSGLEHPDWSQIRAHAEKGCRWPRRRRYHVDLMRGTRIGQASHPGPFALGLSALQVGSESDEPQSPAEPPAQPELEAPRQTGARSPRERVPTDDEMEAIPVPPSLRAFLSDALGDERTNHPPTAHRELHTPMSTIRDSCGPCRQCGRIFDGRVVTWAHQFIASFTPMRWCGFCLSTLCRQCATPRPRDTSYTFGAHGHWHCAYRAAMHPEDMISPNRPADGGTVVQSHVLAGYRCRRCFVYLGEYHAGSHDCWSPLGENSGPGTPTGEPVPNSREPRTEAVEQMPTPTMGERVDTPRPSNVYVTPNRLYLQALRQAVGLRSAGPEGPIEAYAHRLGPAFDMSEFEGRNVEGHRIIFEPTDRTPEGHIPEAEDMNADPLHIFSDALPRGSLVPAVRAIAEPGVYDESPSQARVITRPEPAPAPTPSMAPSRASILASSTSPPLAGGEGFDQHAEDFRMVRDFSMVARIRDLRNFTQARFDRS